MKGRDWIEVDIGLQVVATLNGDRRGTVGIGCAVVVRGRIGNVQRSGHGGGSMARAFAERRNRMHGIPGSCCHRQVVIPGSQGCKLVGTLIVTQTVAGSRNPVHAGLVVLYVEHDTCIADRIARFIDHFAANSV